VTVARHAVSSTVAPKPRNCERVYRAFLDAGARAKWLPPNGFTDKVHHLDARVGGGCLTSLRNVAYHHCRYAIKESIQVNTRIQKWGNSLALRIPAPFAQQVGIENGSEVDLAIEEDGSLRVRPLRARKYDLASMLEQITDDNLHAEVDFGPPAGREQL